MSFLQKTPSQCKQMFFSCFTGMGGWELRVFLCAKPCGREHTFCFFVKSLNLAVQPHLSLACTTPFIVTACLARLHMPGVFCSCGQKTWKSCGLTGSLECFS